MANLIENTDGIIIIGVDEEEDYRITGVENDPNRRKTQDLVCLLRDKNFAGGIRPIVMVQSFEIQNHTVDIIVVKNSMNMLLRIVSLNHKHEKRRPRFE